MSLRLCRTTAYSESSIDTFSQIAVETDHAWLRVMVSMFKPFFHGEVRLFPLSELPAAKAWITEGR